MALGARPNSVIVFMRSSSLSSRLGYDVNIRTSEKAGPACCAGSQNKHSTFEYCIAYGVVLVQTVKMKKRTTLERQVNQVSSCSY